MDIHNLAAAYRGLPDVSQVEALLRLGHELTGIAREEYGPPHAVPRPERLCQLNELQHRVSRQVLALLNTGQERCPDEILTAAILNQDDAHLKRQVGDAFARSLTSVTVA